MKKIVWSLPIALLFTLVLGVGFVSAQTPRRYYDWSATLESKEPHILGVVYAQSSPSGQLSRPENYQQFNRYLFFGNATPDNPFYFVKTLQENIQLTLTTNPVQKEEMRIAIAGEKLDEIKILADANKTAAVRLAAGEYERAMQAATANLDALKNAGANIKAVTATLQGETAKHTIVLERVSVKVPEAAQEGIDRALETTWKGTDKAADLSGRPAVPADVVDRLGALKAQGLLTEEETTKLISAKTRVEARSELKKYVDEGVVPESDFLRLNENVRTLYPQEFFKIHEMMRFYELKKLETERPNDATLARIQEFAKTYKSGEVVPSDIRKFWVPVVRLEEIQNTLRPDLIDDQLFKNKQDDFKKYTELVERFKPRPEDLAYLNTYLQKNPNAQLPPEYERMRNLGDRYGAQCGPGQKWFPPQVNQGNAGAVSPFGGYCAAAGSDFGELPRADDFAKGKACSGAIASAKGPSGACSTFSADCIPPGWSKVASCVQTPVVSDGANAKKYTCPSNAHWVPVPYLPDGGYCIPNYTPIGWSQNGGPADTACTVGYHRTYQSGPCLPNYTSGGGGYLTPVSATPGTYPSPLYPIFTACGPGNHWVPEPINPRGGYCTPDVGDSSFCPSGQYRGPGGYCTSTEKSGEAYQCSQSGKYWDGSSCKDTPPPGYGTTPGNGTPNPAMGNCRTPGECYDWCKSNPGKCSGFSADSPRPGDTPSTPSSESQEAACRAGGGVCASWNNGACGCVRSGSTGNEACWPPGGGCGSGKAWDQAACTCRDNGSYPSSCTYPSSGCGSGYYWDGGSCMCRANGTSPSGTPNNGGCTNYTPGMCGSGWFDSGSCSCKYTSSGGTGSTGTTPPPSGYGACGAGLYWNGSGCVSSSSPPPSSGGSTPPPSSGGMSRDQQQAGCTACGGSCTWNGDFCNCQCHQSSPPPPPPPASTSNPPPPPPPASNPPPPPPPASNPPPPASNPPPPPSTDPAAACTAMGKVWQDGMCK